jgi:hypothetical protein
MIEAMKQALEALDFEAIAHNDPQTWGVQRAALRQAIEHAEKQEPVKMVAYNCLCGRIMKFESVNGIVAPQREWVGLTRSEIGGLLVVTALQSEETDFYSLAKEIEAKLKEKNT